ncbi:MAG: WYL domain-containing protein [Lachnospiraceae bacterium]|nr:WYL domain-containing protein [Lachnospiraceae bacterium]
MSRGTNQKFKFPYLMKIMQAKTDDEHSLTMPQIMEELEKYDVTAERKSIYADFADMTEYFDVEIIKEQIGRETYYHVGSREFDLAEVKLLIDAIQSSKFITEKKSRELIKKMKSFVSEHQAKQLDRQVYVQGRAKTMNESIYYNVDELHRAIAENKKISFKYYRWNVEKKLEERNHGIVFTVSPWALTWDDENYYMVAFDNYDQKIKHYRVDKMKQIELLEDRRDGKEAFKGFDMAAYSKMNFGMYSGRKEKVRIEFNNYMVGVFIDRFGKDISIIPAGDNSSCIHVDVAVSPQFFAWILSLGDEVKVTGPDSVVEEMKEYVRGFLERY